MSSRLIALVFALSLPLAAGARAQDATNSVPLAWTAPGDDSLSGTAAQYDLRWSTSPINASNFTSATRVTGVSAPSPAGTIEHFTVTGLTPNTTYWFAIKTADERPNWSGISNLVQHTTSAVAGDTLRPAALAIASGATTANSVTVTWAAVGDDSLAGTATAYDARWSTTAITEGNWASASLATGEPTPGASGAAQSFTYGGLNRGTDLWFAIKVRDDAGQWSALSNVLLVTRYLDTAPPAAPAGVAASTVTATAARVQWSANAEPDLAGYTVYRATSGSGPWSRLTSTLVTGTAWDDASLPDSGSVWYQVTATDQTGNESARSAAVQVSLAGAGILAWSVQPAYPNPSTSHESVRIPFRVPPSGPFDATLEIVNSAGEHVRTLSLGTISAGAHEIAWDGRNDAGRQTAPGSYRACLRADGTRQMVKLVRVP